ncbi:hypothetical protein [Mesorhizobium sp.]|uniref:hypothetical protein n=1 Tax=Mesorhizobium sp. TaxID=1871066 RepID=UPI00257B1A48|nr:hypothetical protein [Mesorhizobium sp.]
MLKRLSPRDRFEQLVSTYEPMLRTAFIEAIDDIRSNIVLRRVVERLERGDVNGAIAAMNLDEAAGRSHPAGLQRRRCRHGRTDAGAARSERLSGRSSLGCAQSYG